MRKPIGKIKSNKLAKRVRRHLKIRKTVIGTVERPRICVVKSNKNLFVQIINDDDSKTIASVGTFGKNAVKASANKEGAKLVGKAVAELMKTNKMEKAVYDRNGYQYHGVIAALADSIRENGINI